MPGIVSWSDKTHPQPIPSKTWTTLTFNGETKATLAGGRTIVTAQIYGHLTRFVTMRPTWFEIRLVRNLPDGSRDETARDVRAVPLVIQEWAAIYTTEMYTEPDKPISIEVWHNGAPLTLSARIFKLVNVAQPPEV